MRRLLEQLSIVCDELALTIDLIAKANAAPDHWILGRPSPAELGCSIAAVPMSLVRFDLALATDYAQELLKGGAPA